MTPSTVSNTPIALSPTRNDTVYLGGQFLFRTRIAANPEKISPIPTTDDPEKQKQIDSGGLTPTIPPLKPLHYLHDQ